MFKRSFKHKMCELIASTRTSIMEYPETKKALLLVSDPKMVQAHVNNRDEHIRGSVHDANSERKRSQSKLMAKSKGSPTTFPNVNIRMEVEQHRGDISKMKQLAAKNHVLCHMHGTINRLK